MGEGREYGLASLLAMVGCILLSNINSNLQAQLPRQE